MDDLISRQAAIAEINKLLYTDFIDVEKEWDKVTALGLNALKEAHNDGLYVAISTVHTLPAADISEQLENAYAHGYTAAEAEFRKVMETERWIPVTERLPEGYEEILMCDKQGNISTGGYCGGERPFEDNYGYYMDEVIAWQPLPEPYKGG